MSKVSMLSFSAWHLTADLKLCAAVLRGLLGFVQSLAMHASASCAPAY